MKDDLGDDYLAHMKKRKFPAAAIAKDISELAGVLRWRKFKFPRAITLSGPPDAIRDLVAVDSVDGDGGQPWTRITIRAQLQSQE